MAVISIKQINQRSATAKLSGKKAVRTHTQVWRAITSSPTDTSYMVQAAFPPLGSVHPNDPYAYLTSKDPQVHDRSKHIWHVTLVYTTEREWSDNPLDDPIECEWDTDISIEPYLFDRDGNPMLNSAGQPYSEAIKGEKAYWTVVCTSNQLTIPAWLDDYKNAYNSDSCVIDGLPFAPGQCKIKKIHLSRWQTREEFRYRVLQLTIKITENPTINLAGGPTTVSGWAKNVIDEGLVCKTDNPIYGSGKVVFPCHDSTGRPAQKPVPLDGHGAQLIGPDGGPPTAEQIVFNSFNIYKALPFTGLPITN